MQKIVPFLWFNDNAEAAMNFYVSTFKNSKVGRVTRYGDAGPGPKGSVMWCTFTLEGQEFHALNGGPHFKFTQAISLFVKPQAARRSTASSRLLRRLAGLFPRAVSLPSFSTKTAVTRAGSK